MRPLWTLEELGVDFTLETMPFPPRYTVPGYKEINPLGTIPCYVDGNLNMTESAAICHYLVEKHGPTDLAVTPDDPEYGDYLNWLHRSDATFTFPQALILRYTVLEPEERRSPQVAEDYRKWFLARMRSVETALETRDYLCAGRFTIADICVGFAIHHAVLLGIEEVLTPNTAAYWERLQARPAYDRACR